VPEIVIPRVVREATARRVLTAEYAGGLGPDEATAASVPAELRDRWGQVLFDFVLRGLYVHRWMHADPNLANFAFRADGRVVVYDFGCVKEVPLSVAQGYARLAQDALLSDGAEIPALLRDLGVFRGEGELLAPEVITPYLAIFAEIFRAAPLYRFGEGENVYQRLLDLGWSNVDQVSDLQIPANLVFINRTLGGLFGNLVRLRAAGPWRERGLAFAATALAEVG